MNKFGSHFRINIFGESHGDIMGITLDHIPPGIEINITDFQKDIDRRKPGKKGTTPRKETDQPIFASGVFNGKTTGAPLTILIENNNTRPSDYKKTRSFNRPGHADFVANEKFNGFEDYRGGGHFSGRLTVLIVCAGVIAKKLLNSINIKAEIIEISGEKNLEKGLQKGIDAKDSVGGIVECRIKDVPIGWGEPFFDSVESVIAHAVFSIPAVRGIEFGTGFKATEMFGSQHNDTYLNDKGTTKTNHSGGIIGGITNGNELVFRIGIKPTSSIGKNQSSWNNKEKEIQGFKINGRHDLCIALRVPVILEAVTAIALLDLKMQSVR